MENEAYGVARAGYQLPGNQVRHALKTSDYNQDIACQKSDSELVIAPHGAISSRKVICKITCSYQLRLIDANRHR